MNHATMNEFSISSNDVGEVGSLDLQFVEDASYEFVGGGMMISTL